MPTFTGPLKSWNIEPAESAQENAKKSFLSDLGQSMPDLSSTPESFLPAFQPPPQQYRPAGEGVGGFVTDALGNVVAGGLQSLGSLGYAAAEKLGAPETAQNILTGANVLGSQLGTGPYRNQSAGTYERMVDPEWWRTSFSYGMGSSAAFALPGIVIGPAMAAAAVPVATALGVGVTGAAAIGLTTGVLGSAGMDSLLESASAYTDARQSGKTVEEANRIASDVGFNNLVLNVGLETATLGLGVGARSFVRALNKAPVPAVVRGVAGTELAGAAAQNLAHSVGMRGWKPIVVGGAIAVGDALVEAIQEQQQGEIQKAASEGRPWDMVRAMTSGEYTDDGLVGFFNALVMGPLGAGGAMNAAKTLPSTLRGDKATVREAASQAAGAWLQGLKPEAPSFFNTFDFNVPTNRAQPVEIGLSDSARALVQPPRLTPAQKTALETVQETMASLAGTAAVTPPAVTQPIGVPSLPESVSVPPMATAAAPNVDIIKIQDATSRRREAEMAAGNLTAPELLPVQAGAPNHYVSDSYGMIDTIANAIQAENPELATRVRESLREFSASPAASGLTAGLNTYINDAFSGREDSAVTRVLRRIAEENGLIGKEGLSMASPNIGIVLAAPDVSLSGHATGGSIYNPSSANVFSTVPGASSFEQGRYITINAVTPYLQAKALEQSGAVTKEEASNIFAASLLHTIAHEMLHPMGLVHGGQSQPGLVSAPSESKYYRYQKELLQAIVEDTAASISPDELTETYLSTGIKSDKGIFPSQYLSAVAQAYGTDGLEKFAKTYLEGYDEWLVSEVAKDPNGGESRASELRANRQSSRSNSGNGELGIYRRGIIEPFRRSFASRRATASEAGVSASQQGATGGEPRGAAAPVVQPAQRAQPAPPAQRAQPAVAPKASAAEEKATAIDDLITNAQMDYDDLNNGFDYTTGENDSNLLDEWGEDTDSKLFDRAVASLRDEEHPEFLKYQKSILRDKKKILASEAWRRAYVSPEEAAPEAAAPKSEDAPEAAAPEAAAPEPVPSAPKPAPSTAIVSQKKDAEIDIDPLINMVIQEARSIYESLDEDFITSKENDGTLGDYLFNKIIKDNFSDPSLLEFKNKFIEAKEKIINSKDWIKGVYGIVEAESTSTDFYQLNQSEIDDMFGEVADEVAAPSTLPGLIDPETIVTDAIDIASHDTLQFATEDEVAAYIDYVNSNAEFIDDAQQEKVLKPLPKFIESDNVSIDIAVVESEDEEPFETFVITIEDPMDQTIELITALTKLLTDNINGFKMLGKVINPRQAPSKIRFRIYADELRAANGNITPDQLLEKIQHVVSPQSFTAEQEAKIKDDRTIIAQVRAKITNDREFQADPTIALNTFNALIQKIAADIALEDYLGIKEFTRLYNDALREWIKDATIKVASITSFTDRARASRLIQIIDGLDTKEIEAIAARSLFNAERKARSFEDTVRQVAYDSGDKDLDNISINLPRMIQRNPGLGRKIFIGSEINFSTQFWESMKRSAINKKGILAQVPREYLAIRRAGVTGKITSIGVDGVSIEFKIPVETINKSYGNIEAEIVPSLTEIIRVKIPATKAGIAVLQRGILSASPITNLNEDITIGDADPKSYDYGLVGIDKSEIGLENNEKYPIGSGSIIGIYPNVTTGQDTSSYRLDKTKTMFRVLQELMVSSSSGGIKDIILIREAQQRVKRFLDTVIKNPVYGGAQIIADALRFQAAKMRSKSFTREEEKLISDYMGKLFYDNDGNILIRYGGKIYKYSDDGTLRVDGLYSAEKFSVSGKKEEIFPIEGAMLYDAIRNKISNHPALRAMQYAEAFSRQKFQDLTPSEILLGIINAQKDSSIKYALLEIKKIEESIEKMQAQASKSGQPIDQFALDEMQNKKSFLEENIASIESAKWNTALDPIMQEIGLRQARLNELHGLQSKILYQTANLRADIRREPRSQESKRIRMQIFALRQESKAILGEIKLTNQLIREAKDDISKIDVTGIDKEEASLQFKKWTAAVNKAIRLYNLALLMQGHSIDEARNKLAVDELNKVKAAREKIVGLDYDQLLQTVQAAYGLDDKAFQNYPSKTDIETVQKYGLNPFKNFNEEEVGSSIYNSIMAKRFLITQIKFRSNNTAYGSGSDRYRFDISFIHNKKEFDTIDQQLNEILKYLNSISNKDAAGRIKELYSASSDFIPSMIAVQYNPQYDAIGDEISGKISMPDSYTRRPDKYFNTVADATGAAAMTLVETRGSTMSRNRSAVKAGSVGRITGGKSGRFTVEFEPVDQRGAIVSGPKVVAEIAAEALYVVGAPDRVASSLVSVSGRAGSWADIPPGSGGKGKGGVQWNIWHTLFALHDWNAGKDLRAKELVRKLFALDLQKGSSINLEQAKIIDLVASMVAGASGERRDANSTPIPDGLVSAADISTDLRGRETVDMYALSRRIIDNILRQPNSIYGINDSVKEYIKERLDYHYDSLTKYGNAQNIIIENDEDGNETKYKITKDGKKIAIADTSPLVIANLYKRISAAYSADIISDELYTQIAAKSSPEIARQIVRMLDKKNRLRNELEVAQANVVAAKKGKSLSDIQEAEVELQKVQSEYNKVIQQLPGIIDHTMKDGNEIIELLAGDQPPELVKQITSSFWKTWDTGDGRRWMITKKNSVIGARVHPAARYIASRWIALNKISKATADKVYQALYDSAPTYLKNRKISTTNLESDIKSLENAIKNANTPALKDLGSFIRGVERGEATQGLDWTDTAILDKVDDKGRSGRQKIVEYIRANVLDESSSEYAEKFTQLLIDLQSLRMKYSPGKFSNVYSFLNPSSVDYLTDSVKFIHPLASATSDPSIYYPGAFTRKFIDSYLKLIQTESEAQRDIISDTLVEQTVVNAINGELATLRAEAAKINRRYVNLLASKNAQIASKEKELAAAQEKLNSKIAGLEEYDSVIGGLESERKSLQEKFNQLFLDPNFKLYQPKVSLLYPPIVIEQDGEDPKNGYILKFAPDVLISPSSYTKEQVAEAEAQFSGMKTSLTSKAYVIDELREILKHKQEEKSELTKSGARLIETFGEMSPLAFQVNLAFTYRLKNIDKYKAAIERLKASISELETVEDAQAEAAIRARIDAQRKLIPAQLGPLGFEGLAPWDDLDIKDDEEIASFEDAVTRQLMEPPENGMPGLWQVSRNNLVLTRTKDQTFPSANNISAFYAKAKTGTVVYSPEHGSATLVAHYDTSMDLGNAGNVTGNQSVASTTANTYLQKSKESSGWKKDHELKMAAILKDISDKIKKDSSITLSQVIGDISNYVLGLYENKEIMEGYTNADQNDPKSDEVGIFDYIISDISSTMSVVFPVNGDGFSTYYGMKTNINYIDRIYKSIQSPVTYPYARKASNGASLVNALLTIKVDSTGQILTVDPASLGIGEPKDFITDIKLDPGYTLQSIARMISDMSNGIRFSGKSDYSRNNARTHVRSTLGWDTAMLANLDIPERAKIVDSIFQYIIKDVTRKTQEYNQILSRRMEQMKGEELAEFSKSNPVLDEQLESAKAIATFMTFFTNQEWQQDVLFLAIPKNKANRPMKESFSLFGKTLKAYDTFRENVITSLNDVYKQWESGPGALGESMNMSALADFNLTRQYAETFANAMQYAIPGKPYRGVATSEGDRRAAAIKAIQGTYNSGAYELWKAKRDNMNQDTALSEALQESSIGSIIALLTKTYKSSSSSDTISFYEAHKDLFADQIFKGDDGDTIIRQLRGVSTSKWDEILGSKQESFKFIRAISGMLRTRGGSNMPQVFHFGESLPTIETSTANAKKIIQYVASISKDIDDFTQKIDIIRESIRKAYPYTTAYKATSQNVYSVLTNQLIKYAFDSERLKAEGIPSGLLTSFNQVRRKLEADLQQINTANLEAIKYFEAETIKMIEGASTEAYSSLSEEEALAAIAGAPDGIDEIFQTIFSDEMDSSGNPIGNLLSNNTNAAVINNIPDSVAVQSSATAQRIDSADAVRESAINLLKEIKENYTEEDIEYIIEAISTRDQSAGIDEIWSQLMSSGANPQKAEEFRIGVQDLEAAIDAEVQDYIGAAADEMDDVEIEIERLGQQEAPETRVEIAENMQDLIANWSSLKRSGRSLLPVFASSKAIAQKFVVNGISDAIVRNQRNADYFQKMYSGSSAVTSENAMKKVLTNIEKIKADTVGQYENGYFVFFAINSTVANYIGQKTVGEFSDLTIEPDMAIGMVPAVDVKLTEGVAKEEKKAKPKKEKPAYQGKYPTVFGVPIEPTDEITDIIEKLMVPPKEGEKREQLTLEEATAIAQRMLSEEFDSIMQLAIREMLPKKRIMLESAKDVKEFFGDHFVAGVSDDLYAKRILHILDKKAGIVEVLTKRGVFPASNAPYRATEEMLDFMLDDKGQLNVIVKPGKVSRGIGAARDKNIGRFWYWDANGNAVVVFDDNGTSYQDTIERNKIQFYADPNTMQDAFTKLMESGMRAAYMKEIGMGAVPRVQQEQPQQSSVEQPSEKAEATTEQIDTAENNQVVEATLDDIMDELSKLLDPNIEVTEDVGYSRENLRYILNNEKVTEYILFNKKLFEEYSDYKESTDRDFVSFTKQHQIVSASRLADHVKTYGWNINHFTLKLLAHLIQVYANENNAGLKIGNLIIDPEYINNTAPVSIAKSVSVAPGATASRIKEPRKILSTDSVATIKPVMEDTAIIPESPGEPKPKADKEWGLGRARAWVAYRYASMLSGPTMLFDFAQGAVKYAKLAADIKLGAAIESSQGVKASARSTVSGDAIKLDDGTFVGFMHGWQAAMQAAMLAAKTGNVPEGMKLDMEHELVSHTLAGTRLENASKLVEGGQRFRFASDMFWMTLGENIAIYTLAHREATREGYASGSAAYAERATYWANTIKAGMYFEKEPGTLNGTDRSLIVPRAIVRPVPGLDGSKIMPPLGKDTNLNGSRPMTIVEEARNLAQNIVYQGKMPGLGMGFTRVLYNNNLARVLIPFMRTATRIAYEGFEMTPVLGQGLLLFDMAKGRYGKELEGAKALKAAGSVLTFGAVKSDAFSRALGPTKTTVEGESALTLGAGIRPVSQRVASQLFGMGVAMVGFSLAAAGMLTGAGPDDDKERKAWLADGNRPYSLKIGNNFYNPTHILGPLAWPLIFGAIMNDAVTGRNKSTSGKEIPVEEFVKSLGTWTINQTGLNNFNVMLTAFNTTGSVNALERIAAQTLVSYSIPYSSALKWLANISDSTVRDPQGFLDYGKQYIPGVAKLVPAKYNDMYEPVKKSAAQQFAAPLVTSSIDTSRTIYPEFLAKSMQETVRINQAQARVNAYYRGDPGASFPTREDLEIVKRHGLQGTNPTYAMRKSINKMIQKINEEKSNDRSWIPI